MGPSFFSDPVAVNFKQIFFPVPVCSLLSVKELRRFV